MKPENVKEVLEIAAQRLARAGCDTPGLDAEVLLAHTLETERTWLYTHSHEPLDKNQADRFYDLLSRRECREPVAYITGRKEFFALELQVNRHVLIPRPETELLVETAIQMAAGQSRPNPKPIGQLSETLAPALRSGASPTGRLRTAGVRNPKSEIVDVGTGSGCIAIALAKSLARASIFAIDASGEALRLARQNAVRHGVANRITFLSGNLLEPLPQPVDLIVSNPPYVSSSELAAASVSPEVSRYEPHLALNGGQDGLGVIRQLLPQAREKLKPGGHLLLEIGAMQGQAVTRLARTHFPGASIQVKKDLAGLDRLLMLCLCT